MPPKEVSVVVRFGGMPRKEQARSVKQILSLLSTAAKRLHETLHSALCLWLQMHEAFQQQKQNAYAEAAVQAVQAALHAASMCATDDLKLAWMKLHVANVSTAVTAYVVAQSELNLKRVGVLQRLMTAEGQQAREQLTKQWKTAAESHWQLFAAGTIAAFLAPLATITKALSDASSSNTSSRWQRTGLMRSSQQADELLMWIASELGEEHLYIHKPIARITHVLQSMGAPLGLQLKALDNDTGKIAQRALDLQIPISTVWLDIALSLPPTDRHDAAQAWVEVVDWQALAWGCMAGYDLQHAHMHFGLMLCCILARLNFRKLMVQEHMLHGISLLLAACGTQIQHLGGLGVPQDVVQLLLQKEEPQIRQARDIFAAQCSQMRHAEVGDGCTLDSELDKGDTPDHEDKLNDMQALVELMYGTLNMKE